MSDLNFLIMKRGKGKSTALIYTSATTGIPIVTYTKKHCGYITEKAREYGVKIPTPVTVEEVRNGNLSGTGVTELLIDDAEEIIADALRKYLGRNVVAATLTDKNSVL